MQFFSDIWHVTEQELWHTNIMNLSEWTKRNLCFHFACWYSSTWYLSAELYISPVEVIKLHQYEPQNPTKNIRREEKEWICHTFTLSSTLSKSFSYRWIHPQPQTSNTHQEKQITGCVWDDVDLVSRRAGSVAFIKDLRFILVGKASMVFKYNGANRKSNE